MSVVAKADIRKTAGILKKMRQMRKEQLKAKPDKKKLMKIKKRIKKAAKTNLVHVL